MGSVHYGPFLLVALTNGSYALKVWERRERGWRGVRRSRRSGGRQGADSRLRRSAGAELAAGGVSVSMCGSVLGSGERRVRRDE